ncbi:MAG: sulfatase-like hydrolase/transferase [Planctomycetia bacterium]|nr:sulfatase-like hydrolase/transferase [Planctomycetia bacterium]
MCFYFHFPKMTFSYFPSYLLSVLFFAFLNFPLYTQEISSSTNRNTSHSSEAPNVILIMLDDVGFGDLPCYGNKRIQTPNIHWLYENSIRMNNYHSSTISAQTSAALLTGRYPERMGVWRDAASRNILRFGEITLPEILKKHGYRTAVYGKWHLGNGELYRPEFRGFDDSLIIPAGGLGQISDWWGNTDHDPIMLHNGKQVRTRGNITKTLFQTAQKFALQKNEKPFFIYLPLTICAPPYRPTEKYLDHFRAENIPEETAKFYALLCEFDDSLGELLRNLQKNHILRNTVIILTSDNGSAHTSYNHLYSGAKGSLRESGHRVPFFISWQQKLHKKFNTDINRLVAHIDVTPTILDFCGIPTDHKLNARFDGVSFRPILLSGGESWYKRTLFMQPLETEKIQSPAGSLVMTDKFRLLNGQDLYDLQQDSRQNKEVTVQFPEEKKLLTKLYQKWHKEVILSEGARINPIYVTGDMTFSQKILFKDAVQKIAYETEKTPDLNTQQKILKKLLTQENKFPDKNKKSRSTSSEKTDPTKKSPNSQNTQKTTFSHTTLTCSDWRISPPLVFPEQILLFPPEIGFWDVEFLQEGTYEFTLRISPLPLKRPIPATHAVIYINEKSYRAPVPQNAADVKFRLKIPAGSIKIRASFLDKDRAFGAFFVLIQKISE